MFENRKDAGVRLGFALERYRGADALVLAIPRGGVEVGYYVARHLGLELSAVVARKLPYPDNPEAGFGAVAEDGSIFMFEDATGFLTEAEIAGIIAEQKKETERRVRAFRGRVPLPDIKGRTVILVDDGIAMGSTIRAALALCRHKEALKVVVASPVASQDTAFELRQLADDVVILEMPAYFRAVAQVYRNWYDVPDREVLEFLKKAAADS